VRYRLVALGVALGVIASACGGGVECLPMPQAEADYIAEEPTTGGWAVEVDSGDYVVIVKTVSGLIYTLIHDADGPPDSGDAWRNGTWTAWDAMTWSGLGYPRFTEVSARVSTKEVEGARVCLRSG